MNAIYELNVADVEQVSGGGAAVVGALVVAGIGIGTASYFGCDFSMGASWNKGFYLELKCDKE